MHPFRISAPNSHYVFFFFGGWGGGGGGHPLPILSFLLSIYIYPELGFSYGYEGRMKIFHAIGSFFKTHMVHFNFHRARRETIKYPS